MYSLKNGSWEGNICVQNRKAHRNEKRVVGGREGALHCRHQKNCHVKDFAAGVCQSL